MLLVFVLKRKGHLFVNDSDAYTYMHLYDAFCFQLNDQIIVRKILNIPIELFWNIGLLPDASLGTYGNPGIMDTPTLPLIVYLLLLRFNQYIDQKASVHFRVSISGRWSQTLVLVAANNILI